MAKVIDNGEFLTLKLPLLEKIGALHGDIKVAKSNLVAIENEENPWRSHILRGVRGPGTVFPFVILLGTMRSMSGKDFTAIYRRGSVDIYKFKNSKFERWIISK